MRLMITFACITFLTACANTGSNYTQSIRDFRGSSADTLIKNWGTPNRKITNADGTAILIYKTSGYPLQAEPQTPAIGVNVPASGVPVMTMGNPQVGWNRIPAVSECTIMVGVNKNNTIVSMQTMGNNCERL